MLMDLEIVYWQVSMCFVELHYSVLVMNFLKDGSRMVERGREEPLLASAKSAEVLQWNYLLFMFHEYSGC